jgi:uncharacterized protein (TIGR02646 family)
MLTNDVFFPKLKRRESYSVKQDGAYYVYHHYREEIRQDCVGRCAYCDAHENEIGGQEAMELDHFRPRSCAEHLHLVNDPNNLVWSCRHCNHLKSDHWPALGTSSCVLNGEGFLDPLSEDRHDFFSVMQDGELVPLKAPAQYMLDLLALNRDSRRRIRRLRAEAQAVLQEIDGQANNTNATLVEISGDQGDPNSRDTNAARRAAEGLARHILDFTLR